MLLPLLPLLPLPAPARTLLAALRLVLLLLLLLLLTPPPPPIFTPVPPAHRLLGALGGGVPSSQRGSPLAGTRGTCCACSKPST